MIAALAGIATGFTDRPGFATVAIAADSAPATSSHAPFVMRPGVVADPTVGRLYMMTPQGGIDAVEVASGKLLWTTMAAAKPLVAFDGQLLAQAEATRGSRNLPIVLLNAHDGSRRATVGLPMPPALMPSVSESLGTSSSVTAAVVQHDAIILWNFSQSKPSGVLPPPEPAREAEGAFSLNLKTLAVTPIARERAAAKLDSIEPVRVATSSLRGSENLYVRPQRADEFFVGVQILQSNSRMPAVLKRWNAASGAALPDMSLGASYAASAVSSDGVHFLAVTIGKQPAKQGMSYTWSVYDIASGQRIAELPLTAWAPPFFVWRSILVYESTPFTSRIKDSFIEEPLELHGLNLNNDSEIWKRALRDTTFRGPQPPRS